MLFVQIALVDKCVSYNGNSGRAQVAVTPGSMSLNDSGANIESSSDEIVPYSSLMSSSPHSIRNDPQEELFYSYVEVSDLVNRHDVQGQRPFNSSSSFHQPFYVSTSSSSGFSSNNSSGDFASSGVNLTSNNFRNNDDNYSFLNVSIDEDDEEETCSSNGDDSYGFMADFRRDKLGVAAPFSWDSKGRYFCLCERFKMFFDI